MRLTDIRDREKRASKGPWTIYGYAGQHDESGANIVDGSGNGIAFTHDCRSCTREDWETYISDSKFIAYSREDIPFLLELVEEAKHIITGYRFRCPQNNLDGPMADDWLKKANS